MLSGRRFQLLIATLGIETIDNDNRYPVVVPAGEIITVISGPRPDDKRLVDVEWDGRKLIMFSEDVQKRGELVKGEPA
jgi:hypothetical protein